MILPDRISPSDVPKYRTSLAGIPNDLIFQGNDRIHTGTDLAN